jgi:hypothetical protein
VLWRYGDCGAYHLDQIAVAAGFDAQHAKAGFLAVAPDAFDSAREGFERVVAGECGHGKHHHEGDVVMEHLACSE